MREPKDPEADGDAIAAGTGAPPIADALASLLEAAAAALRTDPALRAAVGGVATALRRAGGAEDADPRAVPAEPSIDAAAADGASRAAPAITPAISGSAVPATSEGRPEAGPAATPERAGPRRATARATIVGPTPARGGGPGINGPAVPAVRRPLELHVGGAADVASLPRASGDPVRSRGPSPAAGARDAGPGSSRPWWADRPWPDLEAVAAAAAFCGRALRAAAAPAGASGADPVSALPRPELVDDWPLDGTLRGAEAVTLERAAVACDLVARAARSVRRLEDSGPHQHDLRPTAYQGFASAQYLLRTLLSELGIERDPVQEQAFLWLRKQTDAEGVFVKRHLVEHESTGDPDPRTLAAELDALDREVDFRTTTLRTRRKKLDNLLYKCRRLAEREVDEDEVRAEWPRIADLVEAVVETGMPPTNREIRDAVLDALPTLPDDLELEGPIAATLASARELFESIERDDEAEGDRAAASGPASARAAIEEVLARHPGRIVLALNSRSDPAYPYERPLEVRHAFEWLALDYHDSRTGAKPANHLELADGLRNRCNWHYRTSQSDTTVGRFAEWYRCTFDGRAFDLREHIGRGNAKRQATRSIRIGFAWDEENEVVVVGFLGQHQRTRAT